MYKSKLQELCHEKKWGLPRYTPMKDGPDHNPCFRTCVTVNGFSFDSPVACKSSKQAQNQAAMVAFLHFTSPPSSSPGMISHLVSIILLIICNWTLLVLEVECKASTVTVDEHCTLESPEFINSTLTEADNAASEAASMFISLSDGFQDVSSWNYILPLWYESVNWLPYWTLYLLSCGSSCFCYLHDINHIACEMLHFAQRIRSNSLNWKRNERKEKHLICKWH